MLSLNMGKLIMHVISNSTLIPQAIKVKELNDDIYSIFGDGYVPIKSKTFERNRGFLRINQSRTKFGKY